MEVTAFHNFFTASQKRAASVVHVATAASVTHGPYITADNDNVINLLRVVPGNKIPWENVSIPGAIDRPAGADGSRDFMGHGFLAVYMGKDMKPSGEIDKAVREAIGSDGEVR